MSQRLLNRVLILLWAASLALLSLMGLGRTRLFSTLVGETSVTTAVDVTFVLLTVAYALMLRPVFRKIRSVWLSMAVLLPPCLLFVKLVFFP